jgi:hypothetical protein
MLGPPVLRFQKIVSTARFRKEARTRLDEALKGAAECLDLSGCQKTDKMLGMNLPFDPEDVDFCEVLESEQTTVAVKVHFVDQPPKRLKAAR